MAWDVDTPLGGALTQLSSGRLAHPCAHSLLRTPRCGPCNQSAPPANLARARCSTALCPRSGGRGAVNKNAVRFLFRVRAVGRLAGRPFIDLDRDLVHLGGWR